jgi:hypothetical protein
VSQYNAMLAQYAAAHSLRNRERGTDTRHINVTYALLGGTAWVPAAVDGGISPSIPQEGFYDGGSPSTASFENIIDGNSP